jgi:hypothetical protein
MGEYATRRSDRQQIKIGTCENMYYLRWDDIAKVSIDYSLRQPGLRFRLPFPDEDQLQPGEYNDFNRGYRLLPCTDSKATEWPLATECQAPGQRPAEVPFTVEGAEESPGLFQMHHPSGLLINVSCRHGAVLPEGSKDLRPFWNGKDPYPWELCMIKNHENEGLLPIVRCRHCGDMFRSSWAAVLPHIRDEKLRDRLTDYAAWRGAAVAA